MGSVWWQEVAVLSKLRHPNIVQYYGTTTVSIKLLPWEPSHYHPLWKMTCYIKVFFQLKSVVPLLIVVVVISGERQHLHISWTCKNGLTSINYEELPSLWRSTYEFVHSSDPHRVGVSAWHEHYTQVQITWFSDFILLSCGVGSTASIPLMMKRWRFCVLSSSLKYRWLL